MSLEHEKKAELSTGEIQLFRRERLTINEYPKEGNLIQKEASAERRTSLAVITK